MVFLEKRINQKYNFKKDRLKSAIIKKNNLFVFVRTLPEEIGQQDLVTERKKERKKKSIRKKKNQQLVNRPNFVFFIV